MYRSQPVANRICDSKWKERSYRLHRMKLKQIRPSIDAKAPARFAHLKQNLKKAQLEEERIASITRNNRILLRKMTEIMQKSSLDNYNSIRPRSLNREYRKRELMRITNENQAILRRIQQRDANYNHLMWEQERKRNEQYCRNICQYPYVMASLEEGEEEEGGAAGGSGEHVAQSAIAEEARRIREMIQRNRVDPDFAGGGAGSPMSGGDDESDSDAETPASRKGGKKAASSKGSPGSKGSPAGAKASPAAHAPPDASKIESEPEKPRGEEDDDDDDGAKSPAGDAEAE